MNTLSLVSAAAEPCGIEGFAWQLAARLRAERAGLHEQLSTTGRWRDLGKIWRQVRRADLVIMNLHLAAWKRVIVQPFLALLLARLCGAGALVILHEWGDLDWRRRCLIAPYLPLATQVLLSAPRVERQLKASLMSHLTTVRRGIVPIPPNLAAPSAITETELSLRLTSLRRTGTRIIGQFGSIYPKKQNLIVLDVASELRQRGINVFALFVGDFIGGHDSLQDDFARRARALGLRDHVLVTGYVAVSSCVFALLNQVDAFVYFFPDGLTSNRSSVLTCLQAGRTVVVNQSRFPHEFDHHPVFLEQLRGQRLKLVGVDAGIAELASCVEAAIATQPCGPLVDFEQAWRNVLDVIEGARVA